ncbi:hypothetical protein KXX24_004845 [Aspergillus fumigatus]|nr:hypothetical protein KXX66_008931 [Aspergillus fumigatus]KAH1690129.1 hypothetical protein KXX24_004845 [Aspergillus fumigatus]KAH2136631.1 hypothetical protein KXV35_006926 [Aspergillus fumigatus]KAH2258165.1 hypothetical protein KXW72_008485 [Aspergillus fumigatus]KAH2851315.1 hypothetical protein KXW36_005291 [Aspergillus fumigatus]
MALIFELLQSPYFLQGIAVSLLLVIVSNFYQKLVDGFPYRNIPLVGMSRWGFTNSKAKERFVASAKALIAQGFSQGRTAFQVMFSHAPMIVLHPRYMDEVKSHPHLTFDEANRKAFFGAKLPGFEPFGLDKITVDVINNKLTHALGSLTTSLSRESAAVLKESLPPKSDEWQSLVFAQEIPYIVARLSSLVFMGEKVCRDKEWLHVSVNYTIDAFGAARELRLWPSVTQPLVHWFLPSTRRVRKHISVAKKIVQKEIEKRELIRQGKLLEYSPPKPNDALDWFREVAAGRPYDITKSQITLSLAAIHTTSNLLTNIMYDLIAYQEYIQPLRDEIVAVVKEEGCLKKTSLTKLKLMDSFIKETQRLNPVSITSLQRYALADITLSDGTFIPKGAMLIMSAHTMKDESIYPHADTFDGYRFYNKRKEPGNEHRYQLVTTSNEHLGFGHGLHACPGRFFAANEVKILLIHLLLKYDWKFAEDRGRPQSIMYGTEIICDPTVKLLYKARTPEIDPSKLGELSTDSPSV